MRLLQKVFCRMWFSKTIWFEINCVVALVFLFLKAFPATVVCCSPSRCPRTVVLVWKTVEVRRCHRCSLPRPCRDVHCQCSSSHLTKYHFCKEFTLSTYKFSETQHQGGVEWFVGAFHHVRKLFNCGRGWGWGCRSCPFSRYFWFIHKTRCDTPAFLFTHVWVN